MANGTEFLTSNLNIAYPFRENATGLAYADAVHGATATLPTDFFVDAHFSVPYNFGKLYLSQLIAVGGGSFAFTLINQLAVIQAVVTVSTAGWSTVPFFETVTVSNASTGIYGKVVLYGPAVLAYLAGMATDSFGLRLQFESSVVVCRNRSVETFELYTALPPVPAPNTPGPINGDVVLMSGYNVDTTVDLVAEEDQANVTISAPASGEAPCVHASLLPFFRGMMQLLPDANGNVQLTSGDEGCYTVLPQSGAGTVGDPFVFMIQGNCVACCSCDDYKNMATAMKNLLDRSKDILATLSDAHNGTPNGYTAGVNYYNTIVAQLYGQPTLAVSGSRGIADANDPVVRSGSPHMLSMCVALKNNSRFKYMFMYNFKVEFTDPLIGYIRGWSINNLESVSPATTPPSWTDYTSVVYEQFQQLFPPINWWGFYGLNILRGKVLNMHFRLQGVYPASPGWVGKVTVQLALWDGITGWEYQEIERAFDFSRTDPMGPVAPPPP